MIERLVINAALLELFDLCAQFVPQNTSLCGVVQVRFRFVVLQHERHRGKRDLGQFERRITPAGVAPIEKREQGTVRLKSRDFGGDGEPISVALKNQHASFSGIAVHRVVNRTPGCISCFQVANSN